MKYLTNYFYDKGFVSGFGSMTLYQEISTRITFSNDELVTTDTEANFMAKLNSLDKSNKITRIGILPSISTLINDTIFIIYHLFKNG